MCHEEMELIFEEITAQLEQIVLNIFLSSLKTINENHAWQNLREQPANPDAPTERSNHPF